MNQRLITNFLSTSCRLAPADTGTITINTTITAPGAATASETSKQVKRRKIIIDDDDDDAIQQQYASNTRIGSASAVISRDGCALQVMDDSDVMITKETTATVYTRITYASDNRTLIHATCRILKVPQWQTPDASNHTAVAPIASSPSGIREQQATYHQPHVHQRSIGAMDESSTAAATGAGEAVAPDMVHHRNLQHHHQ